VLAQILPVQGGPRLRRVPGHRPDRWGHRGPSREAAGRGGLHGRSRLAGSTLVRSGPDRYSL